VPSAPPDPAERLVAVVLAGGRIAIGTGLWVAPRLTLRALGFSEPDAQALAVARIAGTRDLVLGTWQATTLGDRDRLARATVAVAACDAGDALTFALALGAGERRAGLRGLAGAVPATALGVVLARALRSPGRGQTP
jgi:hypothetical protein